MTANLSQFADARRHSLCTEELLRRHLTKRWESVSAEIVNVNGSNRANGFGVRLGRKIAEGFDAAATPEIIHPAKAHIEPCRGCQRCVLHKPREEFARCHIADDANAIIDRMVKAKFLIINAPVYMSHVPGPFKMLIDRMGYLFCWERQDRDPVPRLPLDSSKAYASVATYAAPTWAYWLFFNTGRRVLKPLGAALGRKQRFHMNFSTASLDGKKLPQGALHRAFEIGRKARVVL